MESHHRFSPGWLRAISNPSSSLITHIVNAEGDTIAYLHASTPNLLYAPALVANPDIEPGDLCCLRWPDGTRPLFSLLPPDIHRAFTDRRAHSYPGRLYDSVVLPGLLLAQRVLDYEKRKAIVQSVDPLVISVPESESSRLHSSDVARFIDSNGEAFDVRVDELIVEAGERTRLVCRPVSGAMRGLTKNSTLDYGPANPSIVTLVLERFYARHWTIDTNRDLLNRIYGPPDAFSHPRAPEGPLVSVELSDGHCLLLDAPQSEAWRRFMTDETCRAFAFEGAPGCGKSLLAVIMTLAFCSAFASTVVVEEKPPLQLLLTPTASGNRALLDALKTLEWKSEHRILNLTTGKQRGSGEPNIVIGTIEEVLERILDDDELYQRLQKRCRRVTIDDAHRASEAQLNTLALCFPQAKLALMADPIRNDPPDLNDVAAILAGDSAIEAIRRKRNIPIIKTNYVYRASQAAIGPYSDAFYGGRLFSKLLPDVDGLLLPSIWKRARSDCLLMIVAGAKATPSGRSLINDAEIDAMNHVVGQLRQAGYDHESVMVVALYDAQKQLALAHLPDGYEVLSVEEARGREQDIVIVLTTRDVPVDNYQDNNYTEEDARFESDQICNVAISRHRCALIVLGSQAILDTWWQWSGDFALNHPWARLASERGERGFSRIVYKRQDNVPSSSSSEHVVDGARRPPSEAQHEA